MDDNDPAFELAEINIGRLHAPIDDPMIADFADALDEINALADTSPGFRWRFQTEEGNATAVHPFPDELTIINMSVWSSIGTLSDYVFRTAHTPFLRRRREWFERMVDVSVALWWVPVGAWPTVDEGIERLERLRTDGPTPTAFTFRQAFDPSGSPLASANAPLVAE